MCVSKDGIVHIKIIGLTFIDYVKQLTAFSFCSYVLE